MRIGRRLVLLLMLVFTLVSLLAGHAFAFTDVPTGHTYGPAIEDLSARGIINGFPDGTFGPGRPVTRQQFAKMIVLTMELPVSEADVCPFGDVQIGGYADPYFPDNYIAVCATNEITKGTSATTFSPGDPIKRAQFLTMVVRAANRLRPGMLAAPSGGYSGSLPAFTDPDHAANLRVAEYNGLLVGLLGFGAGWDPWAPAARGEVAQVLHNLLLQIDSTSPSTTTTFPTTTTTIPPSTTTTVTTLPPTTTTTATGTKVAQVTASVSDSSPQQYSDVTAYATVTDSAGRVVPGASVSFTWNFKTVTHTMSTTTNSSGVASVTRDISGAAKGYRVAINVQASGGGGSASASTSFSPQ